jgi:hypothetical protein
VRHYIQKGRVRVKFMAVRVPRQCPLVLLVKVGWRGGKTFGLFVSHSFLIRSIGKKLSTNMYKCLRNNVTAQTGTAVRARVFKCRTAG